LKDKLDVLMRYNKYGEGIRKIARETGFSRNTVREYIRKFEEDRKALMKQDPDMDTLCIIDTIVEKPQYNSCKRTREVMTDEFIEKIKEYLSDNDFKRENGLKKQCMTAQDIHENLLLEGYKGSYPTTCIYVRNLKNKAKEAFIKQIYEFGDICEFDWGDIKLRHEGKIKAFKIAVFTSAKNNARVAFLYKREDMQAFIDAHARFFELMNGVYKTMVYDNMKVAVAKFVGLHEKEPTEALKKLSLFYGFNYRFCNIYSGNEKPHVERSVDVIRRKAFSRSFDFAFEEAEEHLKKILKAHNGNLIEEEKPYLMPYPGKYETAEIRECFVDKYSTISYLNNKYSVPDHLVGKYVCLKAYVGEIVILQNKEKIASHKRLYGFNEWSINIYHYVRTITRKPGSLKGSLALSQLQDDLKQIYIKCFTDRPKEFIKVLELAGDIGKDKVLNKISELDANNIPVTFDNIKAVVFRKEDSIDDNINAVAMLTIYDNLFSIGGKAI
jgi:transposase-like protein